MLSGIDIVAKLPTSDFGEFVALTVGCSALFRLPCGLAISSNLLPSRTPIETFAPTAYRW
jgi:hypothetical protein